MFTWATSKFMVPCLSILVALEAFGAGFDYPLNPPDHIGYDLTEGLAFLEPYDYGGTCGQTFHPGEDWNDDNSGQDFGGDSDDANDPVFAAADGLISYAAFRGVDWGYLVVIRHEGAFVLPDESTVSTVWTQYGHLAEITTNPMTGLPWHEGETVQRGERIGLVGDYEHGSGRAFHLHFEVRTGNLEPWFFPCGNKGYTREFVARHYVEPSEFIEKNRPQPVVIDSNICSRREGLGGMSVVWEDLDPGVSRVRVTRVDLSGRLLPGFDSDGLLVSETTATTTHISCGVDAAENTHIVWQDGADLMSATISPDAVVVDGPNILVAGPIDQPRVDVEPDGTKHVVWVDAESGTGYYREIRPDCSGQGFRDIMGGEIRAAHPFVLAPGSGNDFSFMSWYGFDSEDEPDVDFVNVSLAYPDCNGLLGPFQQTDDLVVGRSAMTPTLASENAFLVFEGTQGSSPQHVYWLLGAGSYSALDQGSGPASHPSIASLSDQDVLVTWEDDRTGTANVYAQVVNGTSGATIGENCRVTPSGTSARHPSIARAGANRFALVWDEEAGERRRVQCAIRGLGCSAPQETTFVDWFVRPDSATVGNGWAEHEPGGTAQVQGNTLRIQTGSVSEDGAKVYRTLPQSTNVRISGTLTIDAAFNRVWVLVRADGAESLRNGYGFNWRYGSGPDDNQLRIGETASDSIDPPELATVSNLAFQIGEPVDFEMLVFEDNRIEVRFWTGCRPYEATLSSGPYNPISMGSNLAVTESTRDSTHGVNGHDYLRT